MAPLHHPGPKIMARVVEMNPISWPEMLKRMLFHDPVKKFGVQSNVCSACCVKVLLVKWV